MKNGDRPRLPPAKLPILLCALLAAVTTIAMPASGTIEFDVRAYGAAGDGRSDDSGALRSALAAAASAGGGIVYFPPGIYRIDPGRARSS